MTEERRDGGGDGTVLHAIDPELNIFALANGMDLHRNRDGPVDRVLEWFRDGLERRIHLRPAGDDAVDVEVSAEGRVAGVRRRARTAFRAGVAPDELKGLLTEAVDVANGLTTDVPEAT